jgi:hypothetical protein
MSDFDPMRTMPDNTDEKPSRRERITRTGTAVGMVVAASFGASEGATLAREYIPDARTSQVLEFISKPVEELDHRLAMALRPIMDKIFAPDALEGNDTACANLEPTTPSATSSEFLCADGSTVALTVCPEETFSSSIPDFFGDK